MYFVLLILAMVYVQSNAFGFCWDEASKRYDVSSSLLKAIAKVESDFNPNAIEKLDNGESIGIMQINSFWYNKLKKYGIERNELMNPCVNINIGAWILSMEIERYGLNWVSIGAYNAGAYSKKNKKRKLKLYKMYATKVLNILSVEKYAGYQFDGNLMDISVP